MSRIGSHRRLYLLTAISFLFLSSGHAEESTRLQPSATSLASTERPLSDPVAGEAVGRQYSQDVASSGDDFLVVWVDERSARDNGPGQGLYAARVSRQGDLLDPIGILISNGPGGLGPPTVAWNGRDYVVAWTEGRAAYVALVSSSGAVRPAGGKRIADLPLSTFAIVASNQASTLVYYVPYGHGTTSDRAAQGFLLDHDDNISPAPTLDVRGDFALATDGTNYVFAILAQNTLKTWVIGSEGNLQDENVITLGSSGSSLELASNGEDYLAVWAEYTGLRSLRLTSAGAMVEAPKPLTTTDLFFSGLSQQYVLTWQQDHYAIDFMAVVRTVFCFPGCDPGIYDLRQIRLERDGSRTDPTVVTLSARQGNERGPRTAVANGISLVVWTLDYHEVSATLMANGAPVSQIVVSRSVAGQRDASVASTGSVYLAAWLEERASLEAATVLTSRFDSAGIPLDGPGVEISGSQQPSARRDLSVASDGIGFLVVWLEEVFDETTFVTTHRVLGRRIQASGQPADGAPIVLVSTSSEFIKTMVLTSDSDSYILFWSSVSFSAIFARATRIDRDGSVAETVELPQETVGMRVVNSEGPSHLLLASDERLDRVAIAGAGLRAVFLSRSLTLERSLDIASREFRVVSPRVAFNGSMYLVVWSVVRLPLESLITPGSRLLRASRITTGGQLLDGPAEQPVVNTFTAQTSPVVAWDGRQFLIRWLDGSNNTNDLVGLELSPDQALAPNPGPGRVLAPRFDAYSLSFLVVPPATKGILACLKLHPEYRVPRSFLRRDFVVTRSRAVRR